MTSFRTSAVGMARLLVLAGALCSSGANAADRNGRPSAQLRRGEEIARLLCSACHVVAQDQEYPPLLEDPAPAFQSIANRPETNAKILRHFILTTHWDYKLLPLSMPNPGLSPADTTAVVRYILSLKGP